jgi:uncharacterized protein
VTPADHPPQAFSNLPALAAWQHREAREGFEVVFLEGEADGYRVEGHTAAVENGQAWAVGYMITLDTNWITRDAKVHGRSASGRRELSIEADGAGSWRVNGDPAPHLNGCLDLDLESSSLTNAFPVHRLTLKVGEEAQAPAAYLRALDLSVERLEQRYLRIDDDGGRQRYRYAAPRFDFECDLAYDRSGLILTYPGLAVRVA